MFASITDFLFSQWIWNITWGVYYLPVNIFVFFVLLKIVGKFSVLNSAVYSFFSNVVSFLLYSLFVVGVLVFLMGYEYIPQDPYTQQVLDATKPTVSLGIIYTILQSALLIFKFRNNVAGLVRLLALIIASNIISVLIICKITVM